MKYPASGILLQSWKTATRSNFYLKQKHFKITLAKEPRGVQVGYTVEFRSLLIKTGKFLKAKAKAKAGPGKVNTDSCCVLRDPVHNDKVTE